MTDYTPGPWVGFVDRSDGTDKFDILPAGRPGEVAADIRNDADASLIIAAPDLFEAALRLEMAELAHANCEECNDTPELAPECCEICFPLFDDARVMRRNAIAKARGTAQKTADRSPEPLLNPHERAP